MSIEAMTSCWGRSFPTTIDGVSSATVRVVALAVADVVNDLNDNLFYGSLAKLAEKVDLNRDTVRRVMGNLVDVGVLSVVTASTGHSPSTYRWIWSTRGVAAGHVEQSTRGETAGSPAAPTAGDPRPRPRLTQVNASTPNPSHPNKSDDGAERSPNAAQEAVRPLCDGLVKSMRDRGLRPPGKITLPWLVEMERMVRIDGRSATDVIEMVEWLGGGGSERASFWGAVIKSPANLREHFDTMRLQRANAAASSSRPGRERSTDDDIMAAINNERLRKHG